VRETIRGGLRVGSLAGKNKALLFKWIWRLEDQSIRGLARDNIQEAREWAPLF
jgi:hypothetical protein